MSTRMKRILIVDDDKDILEALKTVFSLSNYDVIATTRAEDALRKAGTYEPDLILLDVLLSGSDGREICRALKKEDTTKAIPVIMISAHPDVRESTLKSGADSFVAKPFNVSDLMGEVEQCLQ